MPLPTDHWALLGHLMMSVRNVLVYILYLSNQKKKQRTSKSASAFHATLIAWDSFVLKDKKFLTKTNIEIMTNGGASLPKRGTCTPLKLYIPKCFCSPFLFLFIQRNSLWFTPSNLEVPFLVELGEEKFMIGLGIASKYGYFIQL